ncbi:bifunctional nicotinamide-nucleotide adenylyltransferase/Nudix hydroxylase [Larsenimonas suaedae]|uniref:Bifunctional nicotinamide-nucleotide adenylyltransferase/Nudix hydroxylase n=1 Tax=Larsenimonas suaedae TaxID=1851019 RepID=A0ABU1GXR8_9GAMM|nr:bifunctional nicotinamide-nucleotide adenylyltransferase/Nudix hydroxylase [Larsenimonas suaedae]MCM2971379.1 bifunctional nicotinamide-nucleotide adenylyltransferase/Nudix hydroxylase [Larsenimonas suaedae]MDR5896635.1 bifunctional nicotinamide-nucleotide adenylyltransferase/Nudix hydroxylase [Larsenimonas suaedae]
MSDKDFDCLVFIGRFQPPHRGHLEVIHQALAKAHQVIVLVGSAWQARSLRNPWTFDERSQMIRACFSDEDNARLELVPLLDALYNDDVWVRDVQQKVRELTRATSQKLPNVALIGAQQSQSNYFLTLFPQWQSSSVMPVDGVTSEAIRAPLFKSMESAMAFLDTAADRTLEAPVANAIEAFLGTPAWQALHQEHQLLEAYQSAWRDAPYPPLFVTVNAVVVQSGHVLLVERRSAPGEGLYALPGGFVQNHERLEDACLRELRERVRLKVPLPVLKGSLRAQRLFDEPHRSWRGRTLAQAFYFALRPEQRLPDVRTGQSGHRATWLPLAELDPEQLFEDHFFIIQSFLGLPAGFRADSSPGN